MHATFNCTFKLVITPVVTLLTKALPSAINNDIVPATATILTLL
jgi:hypothetical protein